MDFKSASIDNSDLIGRLFEATFSESENADEGAL